jgi:glycine/D-amino acid oxidase-like deaminating enzyme
MKTRVAIIGGGIIGCAAAAMLAERGAAVTVFEATALGAGASGRNLGSVQHPYDADLEPLHHTSLELYRRLASEVSAFAFPERPAGVLLVAEDPAGLRAHADQLAAALPGLRPEFVPEHDLRTLEPAIAPRIGAVRLETGYPVRPEAAVEAFAELGRRRGVEFRIGDVAKPMVENGVALGVRVSDGRTVSADLVLVASGPWTPEVITNDEGWRPIQRTWGVTLTVELPDPPRHILEEEEIGEVAPGGEFRWQVPREERAAFSLATAARRSAVGSTFFPTEPNPEAVEPLLIERARHFVPAVALAPILARRICARPQSVDGRPLIGPFPGVDRLFVCAGHGPWGISTGPGSARLVADAMLDAASHPIPAALNVSRLTGR